MKIRETFQRVIIAFQTFLLILILFAFCPSSIIAATVPEEVQGLEGVVAIEANMSSYTIKSDGTIWAWGTNNYGQLGDNTQDDKDTPVQVIDSDGNPFYLYDPGPSISFSLSEFEQQEGLGPLMITVELSEPSDKTVTVDYHTSDYNDIPEVYIALAGLDYTATSGTLTFEPGETSKSFNFTIIDDNLFESEIEGVVLTLENPVNGILGDQNVSDMVIYDNDMATVSFSSSNYSTNEWDGSGDVLVAIDTPSSLEIIATYALSDGTAQSGIDYTPDFFGAVTFLPGETTKQISIQILDDSEDEADETINMILTDSFTYFRDGPQIGSPNTAVLAIIDDDVELENVTANYGSPVGAVDDFRLTVYFYNTMDTGTEPMIEMLGGGETPVIVPSGGTWQTTNITNDTYVTPNIPLTVDLEGNVEINISGAKDPAGNEMKSVDNAYQFFLDTTPPQLINTAPANEDILAELSTIVVELAEFLTSIDENSVIDSFQVTRGDEETIHGTVVESNDQFTFSPTSGSFDYGNYIASFSAQDTSGNSANYSVLFTIDASPDDPKNPSPADGQTDTSLSDSLVTLTWEGGDPNPSDIVTYQVLFGQSADSLSSLVEELGEATFQVPSLLQGTTYFWQVKAIDSFGNETLGPVWQFTTWHRDLTVTSITWEPSEGIVPDQEATFTAFIDNAGSGSCEDQFQVDFRIDGVSIGIQTVNQAIPAGESVQVSQTWTAQVGSHSIEVIADINGDVIEADETNNSLTKNIPEIPDVEPPEFVGSSPDNNAVLSELSQISITLSDQHGTIDDTAVISSIAVVNGSGQAISGTPSESEDVFTFIPQSALEAGVYTVSFSATDIAGNSQAFSFSFTINSLPLVPSNPAPADGHAGTALFGNSITLTWDGGDPDPTDTVTYQVLFGQSSDSLNSLADALTQTSFQVSNLDQGTTYYWQIEARDNRGFETTGPVWQFTTWQPDLAVSSISWDPSTGIVPDQEITFSATIQNSGAAPCIDSFEVDFRINGISIGTKTITQTIDSSNSVIVTQTWTALAGIFTVEAVADNASQVGESDEGNNSLSENLQEIFDVVPPELIGFSPDDGALLIELNNLSFTLSDQHGTVDDTAVINSVSVTDSNGQDIEVTKDESNDTFTLVPPSPFTDSTYTVSFTAADMAGNTQAYTFSFTVDGTAPAKPVITGGSVFSGIIQARPAENSSNSASVTVTGTREDDTSIWINNVQQVSLGSNDWSATLTLGDGENSLEIWSQDAAGNKSESEWVDIKVDTVKPSVTGITPANNSFINASPSTVVVTFTEATSGLNLDASTKTVKDQAFQTIAGEWAPNGQDQLVFTPLEALADSVYTVTVQLEDNVSNRSSLIEYRFTLDSAAPPAPVVNTFESPTHNPAQNLTGTKEPYAAILLDNNEIIGNTASTTWEYTATLASGTNSFSFTSGDRAGNISEPVIVEIFYDDIPPLQVNTLTANAEGTGTVVALSWAGYDESVHGDIASYRIYWETSSFTDVSTLSEKGNVPAGTFSFNAENLQKGTEYWFAIVAVDNQGNRDNSVSPISATPTDIVPPEDVTDIQVSSGSTSLTFNWPHSVNSAGDLAGYKVYFNGATDAVEIPAAENTYEKTGLNPASVYTIKITAYDTGNNESTGLTAQGYTLLSNPANIQAAPESGYVDLTWDSVTPSEYVKHYAVYVSESGFPSVDGMTPAVTSSSTTAKVAGLTNGTEYFFAVTTVNLSGGEDKNVTTISSTPVEDTQGPEITNIQVQGVALNDNDTISTASVISCDAADPAGVSRLEFSINSEIINTDYSPTYSCYWNINEVDDGAYTLQITAYDTLGNSSEITYTINVALAMPETPVITQPQDNAVTNQEEITVSGSSGKYTEVILYNNNTAQGSPIPVDAAGNFSATITLVEGTNTLEASASNRTGEGPRSAAITVTLDTTKPDAPSNLSAESRESGRIRLNWSAPADNNSAAITGYNLYRDSESFSDISGRTPINTSLITVTSYEDLPVEDGVYYYHVTAVNETSNESDLSQEASAESDRTMPEIVSINYTPSGNYDPATGRMAPGSVDLLVTLSEPLEATPFFSITPENGFPVSVDLIKETGTTYSGIFVIEESTPSGTAWAVFSGRDLAGNRGTEILSGRSILIDTAGPSVITLAIQPGDPVQNDETEPVTVLVRAGLSEAAANGLNLSYLLSAVDRSEVSIDNLAQTSPIGSEAQAWEGSFVLPADAGLAEPETLRFIQSSEDDLANTGNEIPANNLFQIYQGDLPPLDTPEGLTAGTLTGGKIKLQWNEVEGAAGYKLYRHAPAETELTEYKTFGTILEYIDEPGEDGTYLYAIASIREVNSQESVSALSDPVSADSDSTVPGSPQNLTLELVSNGIELEWDAPAYTEPITYTVYRADATEITDVTGLTPLAEGVEQLFRIDPNPSTTERCYVVTAKDIAGNESAPSNSAYLNVSLLPVSGLIVVQEDVSSPVVTWTHPGGSIAGYDIYLGDEGSGTKLNTSLLTAMSYTDTGYAGDERRYTVKAIDDNGEQSLGRSVTLPVLSATLEENAIIKRGIMNSLEYEVKNEGDSEVSGIRIHTNVEGRNHVSSVFTLEPYALSPAFIVIGGYDDLPDMADMTTTIEVTAGSGEVARIKRTGWIEVSDGMLILQVRNDEFTRGVTGGVRFSLENTGEEEIEVITARNGGASNEITFYLEDQDGNVLSTRSFIQTHGDSLVTLSNGNTVARIQPGETFESDSILIQVPANAPDEVIVRLNIANIYFHNGRDDQVKMTGMSTSRDVALIDTSYYGGITDITPKTSGGDENIVITGRALDRVNNQPMADVPLNLVITVSGFERSYTVYTDETGEFSYTFIPLTGEAGVYSVCAIHPDLLDRPVHDQFTIIRVGINPTTVNLSVPYNYEKNVNVGISTGEGTSVSNLRFVYEAADQPSGDFPEGIHLTIGSPVAGLGPNQSANLSFSLWADNSADMAGSLKLRVISDETDADGNVIGELSWGFVTVNTGFSNAQPVLYFTPDHVETGVALPDPDTGTINTITETITFENRGLATLEDASLSLKNSDGSTGPGWVYLQGVADLGDIAVGDTKQASIAFSPTEAIAEGNYHFLLRLESSNYSTTDINLYAAVTQAGEGNVQFKVSDIYTGMPDENGDPIQGLSGAKIYLQNEEVLTIEQTIYTDSLGEAYFQDLPTGSYQYRITANNHQEKTGRIWIKTGVTINEEVFLDYNLVTVEWEVNEITIEDIYEIVLTATYETNVPAAVVVAEPTSINLPAMSAGDVYNGEFNLTNYGLIRADNVVLTLPENDPYFTYELLEGIPESIEKQGRVTIPFRVTCVQSPNQDDGTGGGCERYMNCIVTSYGYECANGAYTGSSTNFCTIYDNGECDTSGSSTGTVPVYTGGGTSSVTGGTTGSGTTSSVAPAPSSVEGVKCFPVPDRKEADCEECRAAAKESLQSRTENTGSSVHLYMREYNTAGTDLSVKTPGGAISVHRRFYDNKWHFDFDRNNLKFEWDSLGQYIETIEKGGVEYEASSTDSDVYIHDIYRIFRTDTGYRWETKGGQWITFDENGRELQSGNRNNVVSTLIYEPGEDGKLIGIEDKDGNQVIWLEYTNDVLSAVRDSENRRVEYTYTDEKLTMVRDILGNDTSYEYDTNGRMKKVTDPKGRGMTIAYDSYNNPASVLDDAGEGKYFEFDYDESSKETYARITTTSGKVKEVWFDRDGETKEIKINGRDIQGIRKDGRDLIVTDENGNVTRKEFDEWDNLTKIIYPDSSEVTHEYEHTYNRRIRSVNEIGIATEYEYDSLGNLTTKTEAVGTDDERVSEYTYDTNGNQLTVKVLGDADTVESITTMTYDSLGNMTSITDPENNLVQFTSHDIMGNVLTKIDARGKTWEYTYDAAGRLRTVTDPLNNVTEIFYDEVGNKIREVDAEARERTYEYDLRDNLIKTVDPAGKETLFEYNSDNKLIRQTDPEGKIVQYVYDNEERLLKTIDGNGNEIVMEYEDSTGSSCSSCSGGGSAQPSRITYPTFSKEFKYDLRDRKTEEVDILSETESVSSLFDYDPAGNLILKTDKEGISTQYDYDALNRLVKVTNLTNTTSQTIETIYTYDDRDNLISLTDAKGQETSFEYDRNNRLVNEIRPMGEETAYQYDEAGNLIEKIDPKGQKTEYVYDDAGRLIDTQYYASESDSVPTKTVTFSYDNVGNLTGYDDGLTSGTYVYDNSNQKISETVDYGSFTKTNTYGYYKNGMKQTFTGPDEIVYGYDYDPSNQLTGVQIPNVGFITIGEYTWNRPKSMTVPGGSTKSFEYDPLMRISRISTKDPGQNVLMNYQYTLDKMDNITAKTTEHGNYGYNYDELYRLTTVDNPAQDDEAFTYDSVGNRINAADTTGDWTYNDNNELLTTPPSSSGSTGGSSFVYDDNGNMTQKTVSGVITKFIYNIEDHLTEVRDGSDNLIASYYYDPFGRRLWKEVSGVKTYFHYADEGLVAELDASGNVTKSYGWSPGSIWGTDPLFMKQGGEYYFYHNDHLGAPQKMTSVNGAVVWSAKYTSFGEANIEVETVNNNLRLAGQYFDYETGLHYNWNRLYNPYTGRYLRVDPIGLDGGVNVYSFALNNPVKYTDPNGLICGNWKSDILVPDYPNGWDFYEPCKNHDECYGCTGKQYGVTKEFCDKWFLKDLLKVCREQDKITTKPIQRFYWPHEIKIIPGITCEEIALLYFTAVVELGQESFRKGRMKCCSGN